MLPSQQIFHLSNCSVSRHVATDLLQELLERLQELETELSSSINGSSLELPWLTRIQEDFVLEVLFDLGLNGQRYTLIRSAEIELPGDKDLGAAEEDEIHLSPREQEIVRLVAKGYPNKTIAGILDISPWTVSTHLRRIFTKLGVNSRAEMVASALVTGLVDSAL